MTAADGTTERWPQPGPRDDPGEPRPGLLVADSYRLLALLGRGGMADVYEAEHVRLGNRVAVKFLRSDGRSDHKAMERFRHEARRVASLNSDHVVRVFDCGELPGGAPYLVMERLLGEDLKTLLGRVGKLPVRQAVELAVAACRGLSVVHAAGLVHRDLKPANLFVVRDASGVDRCKILDFGVAKALVSDATAGGALLGTVRYMAPEQLEDASSARATADIYAVGAILYECLAGVPPHHGSTLRELMFDILHRDPAPLRELRAVPPELEGIVMAALSRDKSKRFATPEKMAEALAPYRAPAHVSRVVEGPLDATLDERSVAISTQTARRSPTRRFAFGVACFATGLAAAASLQSSRNLRGEPRTRAPAASHPTLPIAPPSRTSAEPPIVVSVTIPAPAVSAAVGASGRTRDPKRTGRPKTPTASQSVVAGQRPRFDSENPYSD